MGFGSSIVTLVVDVVTFPVSYIPKVFTGGKTLGDYVTGTERPPSQNSTIGNFGAFIIDVLTSPVSLPLRAFTGNSIGDYVLGDTNEQRSTSQAALASQMQNTENGADAKQPEQQQAVTPPSPSKTTALTA